MMCLIALCIAPLAQADKPVKPVSKAEIVRIMREREAKLVNLQCTVKEVQTTLVPINSLRGPKPFLTSRQVKAQVVPMQEFRHFYLKSTRTKATQDEIGEVGKDSLRRMFDGKYDYSFTIRGQQHGPNPNPAPMTASPSVWKAMMVSGYWMPAPQALYRSWSEMSDKGKLIGVSYRIDPRFGRILVAQIERQDTYAGTIDLAMEHGYLPVRERCERPLNFRERSSSPVHPEIWQDAFDAKKLTQVGDLPFVSDSSEHHEVRESGQKKWTQTTTYQLSEIQPNQANLQQDLSFPEGTVFLKTYPHELFATFIVQNGKLVEQVSASVKIAHLVRPLLVVSLSCLGLAILILIVRLKRPVQTQ